MAKALLLALALATSSPDPGAYAIGSVQPPMSDWELARQAGLGSAIAGSCFPFGTATGYVLGGVPQRGLLVGAGQLGIDALALAGGMWLGVAMTKDGPANCSSFECVDLSPLNAALMGAASYLVFNTAYAVWSGFDAYETVKQARHLGPVDR